MGAFVAKRVSRSGTFDLGTDATRALALFTPEGEKQWAARWDFERVYPNDTSTSENDVFLTRTTDHSEGPSIWIVSRYSSERHEIEYQRVDPGVKVARIRVQCWEIDKGRTEVRVDYVYTGLSQTGNAFVEHFSVDEFARMLSHWSNAIDHFLITAQKFQHP
jgi:hypothetical protein